MNENEEYDRLISEQKNLKSNYRACESRIEKCEYLLRRLRPVKEEVAALKREFYAITGDDKKTAGSTGRWKGEKLRSFHDIMANVQGENETYYRNTLDCVLDTLNNRITEIENQYYQEYGMLGQLNAALNSLANMIENLLN